MFQKTEEQETNEEERPEEKPEVYEVDTDNLTSPIPKGLEGHRWIQRGPYIVCTSCPFEHGTFIGIDKRLVGFSEDGKPIIESLK